MSNGEGTGIEERQFKVHSRRPTQEIPRLTPKIIIEKARSENQDPIEIVEPALRLGEIINIDEKLERIGPRRIQEGNSLILASETRTPKNEAATEFKRVEVVGVNDDPQQEKLFELRQPEEVPARKGHAVLMAKIIEPVGLKDLNTRLQRGELLIFKVTY